MSNVTKSDGQKKGLLPCPHCGATAIMRAVDFFKRAGYMVECQRCKCRTTIVLEGPATLGEMERHEPGRTAIAAMAEAKKIWNTRTGEERTEHYV